MLQPDKGSSETGATRRLMRPVASFNPTRVRLKPVSPFTNPSTKLSLQPHKGSSETAPFESSLKIPRGFNPTKVRLKPVKVSIGFDHLHASTPQGFVCNTFPVCPTDRPAGFNPTRVRLKHDHERDRTHDQHHASTPQGSSETNISRPRFRPALYQLLQPHTGSSETVRGIGGYGCRRCFNPTRVRLKQPTATRSYVDR